MKNFKRFASAILALTLALSLTACGGSKETASDAPADSGDSAPAEETAKVKRENDLLREAQDKRNTEERRDQLAAKRESEIAELRKEFPDFDLAAESKNPQFVSMLRIEALPLRTIYAAIHHDEILIGSVQRARADAEEAAVANIRARGMRPPENGATVTGGVSVSVGVGSLSRKERADVARRAARGERITFRS